MLILKQLSKLSEPERVAEFRESGTATMTAQALTQLLAERVMVWMPRWRFQPCGNLADAFQLLDTAKGGPANS